MPRRRRRGCRQPGWPAAPPRPASDTRVCWGAAPESWSTAEHAACSPASGSGYEYAGACGLSSSQPRPDDGMHAGAVRDPVTPQATSRFECGDSPRVRTCGMCERPAAAGSSSRFASARGEIDVTSRSAELQHRVEAFSARRGCRRSRSSHGLVGVQLVVHRRTRQPIGSCRRLSTLTTSAPAWPEQLRAQRACPHRSQIDDRDAVDTPSTLRCPAPCGIARPVPLPSGHPPQVQPPVWRDREPPLLGCGGDRLGICPRCRCTSAKRLPRLPVVWPEVNAQRSIAPHRTRLARQVGAPEPAGRVDPVQAPSPASDTA